MCVYTHGMYDQIELGPGTAPHPRTTIGLDLSGTDTAPPQDVGTDTWTRYGGDGENMIGSDSTDHVYASHVMEHIPKGAPTIHTMNEAWRVLCSGGVFTMLLPVIGVTQGGDSNLLAAWEPYADPTHVQNWWLPQSWWYFTGQQRFDAHYGIDVWSELPDKPADPTLTTIQLRREAGGEDVMPEPFWTLRHGFEAVVRLVKP